MKALAILGTLLFGWLSGVGIGDQREDKKPERLFGAVVFLAIAISCGWCAWLQ